MNAWQILWRDIRRIFDRSKTMTIDEETVRSLRQLADIDRVEPDRMLDLLIEDAIQDKERAMTAMHYWRKLSYQEKRITALICAGYSTDQIAERLGIAPNTVKTHVKKIFVKYQVHDRATLREVLASYDLRPYE